MEIFWPAWPTRVGQRKSTPTSGASLIGNEAQTRRGFLRRVIGHPSRLRACCPIDVCYRTDSTAHCDETATSMLTRPLAVFKRSDRARRINIPRDVVHVAQSAQTTPTGVQRRLENVDYCWLCCQRFSRQ